MALTEGADSLGLIEAPAIEKRIFAIRGRQVMVDEDLADLYGVETKRLIQQVKRNLKRFPGDFMFQLEKVEAEALRSQIATSNDGRGGRRYAPYVFTEQGVAMLSGVLRSDRAIAVNIAIMRAFVELRRAAAGHAALEKRLDQSFQSELVACYRADGLEFSRPRGIGRTFSRRCLLGRAASRLPYPGRDS